MSTVEITISPNTETVDVEVSEKGTPGATGETGAGNEDIDGGRYFVQDDTELAAAITAGATRITPTGTITLGTTKRIIPSTCMIDPSIEGGYFDLGNIADVLEINGPVRDYGRQLFLNAKPSEGKLPATYDGVVADGVCWGEGGWYKSATATWATTTAYMLNEVVVSAGVYYRAVSAHTSDGTAIANDVTAGKMEACLVTATNKPLYSSVHGSFGGRPVQGAWFGLFRDAPDLDGQALERRFQAAIDCGKKGDNGEGSYFLDIGDVGLQLTGPIFWLFRWCRVRCATRNLTSITWDHPTSGTIWNGQPAANWPIGIYLTCDQNIVGSSGSAGYIKGISDLTITVADTCDPEHILFYGGLDGRLEEQSYLRGIKIISFARGCFFYGEANCHYLSDIEATDSRSTIFNASVTGGIMNRFIVQRSDDPGPGRLYIDRLFTTSYCGIVFDLQGGDTHIRNCKLENPRVGVQLTGAAKAYISSLTYRNNVGRGAVGATGDLVGAPIAIYIPAGNRQVELTAHHIDGGENGSITAPVITYLDEAAAAADPGMYVIDPYTPVYDAAIDGFNVTEGSAVRALIIHSIHRSMAPNETDPIAWVDATAYTKGDTRASNGEFYECIVAHTADDGGTGATNDGAGDNEPGYGQDWPMFWKILPYWGQTIHLMDRNTTGSETANITDGAASTNTKITWDVRPGRPV